MWYWSPHFHAFGFGWIDGEKTKEIAKREGITIQNHGVRGSIAGTFSYQLSHCGVKESFQTITWFGALHYSCMTCPKFKPKRELCPLCKGVLYDVWARKGKPPPMNPNEFNEIGSDGYTTIRPQHTHEKKRSPEIMTLREEWDKKLRNL